MKITESGLRMIARKVLKELFTRKSGIGLSSFLPGPDDKVDVYSYGDYEGFEESEEKLKEDELEEAEEE
jgi:hypothetical protein